MGGADWLARVTSTLCAVGKQSVLLEITRSCNWGWHLDPSCSHHADGTGLRCVGGVASSCQHLMASDINAFYNSSTRGFDQTDNPQFWSSNITDACGLDAACRDAAPPGTQPSHHFNDRAMNCNEGLETAGLDLTAGSFTGFLCEAWWGVFEGVGARVVLHPTDRRCPAAGQVVVYNPPVRFAATDFANGTLQRLHLATADAAAITELTTPTEFIQWTELPFARIHAVTGIPDAVVVRSFADPVVCTLHISLTPAVLETHNGYFYRQDRRLQLRDNTVANPAMTADTTATDNRAEPPPECSSARRNFLNADQCVRGPACAARRYGSRMIQLNHTSLRAFYDLGNKLVYAIVELPWQPDNPWFSPCGGGNVDDAERTAFRRGPTHSRSRWQQLPGCTSSWRPCADDGQTCNCAGRVRYGARSIFSTPIDVASSSISCTAATFGDDPLPGFAKRCECSDDVIPTSRVDRDTMSCLETAISANTGRADAFRDITVSTDAATLPSGATLCGACTVATPSGRSPGSSRGYVSRPADRIVIQTGNDCWEQIAPDQVDYQVHDFSTWAQTHPGSLGYKRQLGPDDVNPIRSPAHNGETLLRFPAGHEWNRWREYRSSEQLPWLGQLGDEIDFAALPNELQTPRLATFFGAEAVSMTSGGILCGSPGEVANEPERGHRYPMEGLGGGRGRTEKDLFRPFEVSGSGSYFGTSRSTVHTMVALTAPDQLRQRVAWALSQIYVLGNDEINVDRPNSNEFFHAYYDIMVRNAFGNLRDVLREVSYSPAMGAWLTYSGSRSYAYGGLRRWPDENYARELMQMFSIGLWQLNLDGTTALGADGEPVPSYSQGDVTELARAWTGFFPNHGRGNLEDGANSVDPMKIVAEARDIFPKMSLHKNHIGDGSALCEPQMFLRNGAEYRLLPMDATYTRDQVSVDHVLRPRDWDRNVQHRDIGEQHRAWGGDPAGVNESDQFSAVQGSALYRQLCAPAANGGCTFPVQVVLASNVGCRGAECLVDAPSLVRVADAAPGGDAVHYEFIRPACVELTFFEGRVIQHGGRGSSRDPWLAKCANPAAVVAGTTCCDFSSTQLPCRGAGFTFAEELSGNLDSPIEQDQGFPTDRRGQFEACQSRCQCQRHGLLGPRFCSNTTSYEGWVRCAPEGGMCTCNGRARFGYTRGRFVEIADHVAGSIECTTDAFGSDPEPGRSKECQCWSDSPVDLNVTGDPGFQPCESFFLYPPRRYGRGHYCHMAGSSVAARSSAVVFSGSHGCNMTDFTDHDLDFTNRIPGAGVNVAECQYHGERTSFWTAQRRCAAEGKYLCSASSVPFRDHDEGQISDGCLASEHVNWMADACIQQVQIHLDGRIAIVDPSQINSDYWFPGISAVDNGNYFRVRWHDGEYPQAPTCGASGGACVAVSSNTSCLCNISVELTAVFTDSSTVPGRAQVEELLHIGVTESRFPPFDTGGYTMVSDGPVGVFRSSDGNDQYDERTVFRIERNASAGSGGAPRHRYLRNQRSTVRVGSGFSFRNPPRFMSLVEPTVRDAMHETEAVIDHIFWHPNIAPYVVKFLAQRLTTSNREGAGTPRHCPNPPLLSTVATLACVAANDLCIHT